VTARRLSITMPCFLVRRPVPPPRVRPPIPKIKD